MRIKSIDMGRKAEFFIDVWRNLYCFIIPILISAFYLFVLLKWDVRIWESKNFTDTLSSVITFVSIIISFFGVLLTLLISVKEKSKMIQEFLKSADKSAFISSIKNLIMCGLLTVLLSACLFLKDIIAENIIVVLVISGMFFLVRFTALTYRFTNILLMLFIGNYKVATKIEGPQLSPEQEKELRERIDKGI